MTPEETKEYIIKQEHILKMKKYVEKLTKQNNNNKGCHDNPTNKNK